MIVMIAKLNSKVEIKLFSIQSRTNIDRFRSEFVVFLLTLVKNPNVVFGDHETFSCES